MISAARMMRSGRGRRTASSAVARTAAAPPPALAASAVPHVRPWPRRSVVMSPPPGMNRPRRQRIGIEPTGAGRKSPAHASEALRG